MLSGKMIFNGVGFGSPFKCFVCDVAYFHITTILKHWEPDKKFPGSRFLSAKVPDTKKLSFCRIFPRSCDVATLVLNGYKQCALIKSTPHIDISASEIICFFLMGTVP